MGTSLRTCPICESTVPADEPMVDAEVRRRLNRRSWSAGNAWTVREPICRACADSSWKPEAENGLTTALHHGLAWPVVHCEHCQMPLVMKPDVRRKRVTCSNRCRQKLAKPSNPRPLLMCDVCGNTFAARAGASYCSPACRQKAYRTRLQH